MAQHLGAHPIAQLHRGAPALAVRPDRGGEGVITSYSIHYTKLYDAPVAERVLHAEDGERHHDDRERRGNAGGHRQMLALVEIVSERDEQNAVRDSYNFV